MKILQNETTNNSTTTSTTTTTNSKEKQQQQIVEKRKAKTLKNKILQNVAQQQQQQEEYHQQQQRQQQHQQYAIANNTNAASAMTDERTKVNYHNNCNSSKTNNSSAADIKTITATSPLGTATNILKDSLKESSSSGNSHNNNGSSNNNSDLIIAEAAKILLKNGLNGTNAAAAAAVATATATLLTAAANYHQLPAVSNTISSTKCNLTTPAPSTTSTADTSALSGNVTTAAAAAHAQLVAIAAAAAAVNASNQKRLVTTHNSTLSTATSSSASSPTCKSPTQTVNNGVLDNIGTQATTATTHFTKPYKTNSCKSTMSSSMEKGIFDYTVNLNSNNNSASAATSSSSLSSTSTSSSSSVINLSASGNNSNSNNNNSNIGQQKFLNNNIHSHSNRADICTLPISQHHHQTSNVNNHKNAVSSGGYGGRLQFFKDGKFILELARSKDGEKEGWVSVPRKLFRTPSAATSSTVTPSATASTSAAAIPSSLVASPVAVVCGTTYPKNECSNSLSFSDDNSSVQSSPWQRDHCWKQVAPRKNVSKDLKLFYRRPAYHKLTTQALLLSYRKRRKPYDTKIVDNALLFRSNSKKQQHEQQVVESMLIKKEVIEVEEEFEKGRNSDSVKSNVMDGKTKIEDDKSNSNDAKEEYDKTSDNKHETNAEIVETKDTDPDVDVEMIKLSSPNNSNANMDAKRSKSQKERICEIDQVDKMNTSECSDYEEPIPTKNSIASNSNVLSEDVLKKHNALATKGDYLKTGDEEKRLKKHENNKSRAKLTTIVQKLIDVSTSRLATTAHLFKTSCTATSTNPALFTSTAIPSSSSTSTNAGVISGGGKNNNSKVSPPANTAASRLVEYHQQHVSPRKRILREFEKVSLEDNTSGGSGGKRSRAKGNITSPLTSISNAASSTSTTNAANKSMSLSTQNAIAGNTPKLVATAAPTKLYSSYSIHSLLGGGVSTSSNIPSAAVKKSADLPATITSSSMAYSPYHSVPFASNSISNNSPKSPESNNMGGGKSPLSSVVKSKRSPPYSSPMRETPSRSPISYGSGAYGDYSGIRSPRSTPDTAHNAFNKLRYNSSAVTDTTTSPINHHMQSQHHLQQHYQHQPQTYYSPYMMSPHYVPPLSAPNALSPNATASANASTSSTSSSTTSSRSPRHHPSAFRATTPTSTSNSTHNIPSTQKGDLSPQRLTTASPRETTPRTVPKKTASIRRQFASPTSATNQNHNNSNCSSPTTTIDEQLTSDRRTPLNSSGTSHQQHQQPQHLMQRGSPGNPSLAGSPVHPYSYLYAQPPNGGNSPHSSNAAGSNHLSSSMSPSSAAVAAAAAAAAAASYIPAVVGSPYYHPYISTLAAMRHPQMWMQHYQTAAAAAAANPSIMQARHPTMFSAAAAAGAAARLSPSYHGFQYNGVNNATALASAAAAAAAAGFGGAATPPHPSNALAHPSSMFHPMTNSSLHGMQHPATGIQTAGLVPASAGPASLTASPMTDTTDLSKTSKNNFSSNTSTSTGSSGNSMYTISSKDDQSADVPLNLSKH